MEFLDHFHDGNGCAESHAKANKLAFGSTECNFGLQLRCPVEWAAGIHDDVAMSGPGSVRVFCIILVPVASKVCINIDVKQGVSGPEDQALVLCHFEIMT